MTSWRDYVLLDDASLFAQCEFDRLRASGPGGQKRNKTESAVRLRHLPTGLAGEANESRSQHENRTRALRRLRLTIALTSRAAISADAYEPSARLVTALGTTPSPRTPELPPILAELFDVLELCVWRIREAATLLGVPSAAVSRLLRVDDRVWRAAAECRQASGLGPLRGSQ
ncbi:MAG: peptide chain release factor-like protein [Dehalococcoidia bacterium]|nr:peptide chain release factor-like protein [Dehalococcoidia bacterium]